MKQHDKVRKIKEEDENLAKWVKKYIYIYKRLKAYTLESRLSRLYRRRRRRRQVPRVKQGGGRESIGRRARRVAATVLMARQHHLSTTLKARNLIPTL